MWIEPKRFSMMDLPPSVLKAIEEWKSKEFVSEEYIRIAQEFKRLKGVIRKLERENAELKYQLQSNTSNKKEE